MEEKRTPGRRADEFAHLHDLHGANFKNTEDVSTDEIVSNFNSPIIDPAVYKYLPELLHKGCTVFKSDRERDVFLTGAITVLSGCFNEVSGLYNGKVHHANMYCFISAPPASGKGVLNYARILGNGIHNRLAAENETAVIAYKKEQSKFNAACKTEKDDSILPEPPAAPVTKLLFVPANSSAAAVMRHIQQNDGRGIICETEADTLSNSFKQDWGGYSDLLRKAFHHEPFSYSRKTNNEYVEVPNPRIAIALTGTPNQVTRLLVSNEDGLVSRFVFYYFSAPPVWQDVSPKDTLNLDEHFMNLSERVYTIHEALKNKKMQIELSQEQWNKLNAYCSAKLIDSGEELRSTVTRIGLILYRIAMVLTVLRHESDYSFGGITVCEDVDFKIASLLADVYLSHAAVVHKSLLTPTGRRTDGMATRFLDALPGTEPFSRKQAIEIGDKMKLGIRTIDKYLKQFCNKSLLVVERHGSYQKT